MTNRHKITDGEAENIRISIRLLTQRINRLAEARASIDYAISAEITSLESEIFRHKKWYNPMAPRATLAWLRFLGDDESAAKLEAVIEGKPWPPKKPRKSSKRKQLAAVVE